MREAIRDTSAQDVLIEKTNHWQWLKWAVPLAVLAMLATLAVPVISTWLSAEASISAERIRTAIVTRGDLVRDLSVQGRVVAAISPAPHRGTLLFGRWRGRRGND